MVDVPVVEVELEPAGTVYVPVPDPPKLHVAVAETVSPASKTME